MISDQAIYDRILSAMMEHRLPPGTKLGEDRLAAIFHVSRSRIRQILARLGHEQIVAIFPNRGAFVARPTVEEAREIFEARRLIEPGLIIRFLESANGTNVERLAQHVAAESKARAENDRRAIIRLSGEFHLLLAEMVANARLMKIMRELVSLNCLIIALYDSPTVPACRNSEHGEIVDAIKSGDRPRAVKTLLDHLDHVEACLDLTDRQSEAVDLEAALA